MQVILTHEQTDFDALASQLGALLLLENTHAILPKTLNRNVREFVRLYGTELPFIQASALPKSPISAITLVDTQSLVTLKGLNKNTKIFVIDHHKIKADLPKDWEITQVHTGSCTSYFVEQLMEKNDFHPNIIEATLLLLGIYEDTGSLTYANTKAGDAAAVAHLLSHGASLKIANEFLNPPLSEAQQDLFHSLIDNSKTVTISNKNILVSFAAAPNLGDEVSSVAHKICDLMDPDALFIFVAIDEGIRLVARSVTDQIDTSIIAAGFNGGGHPRASAALIRHNKQNPSQLEDLISMFLKELPTHVKPEITVGQIMSKKPLTITPETTIKEARTLMDRFGYEGYPVIQGKKILGLLNRRAVDKAQAHNLKITTASLMEAGNYHIYPHDSLDHLQQVMVASGWGQIPVVDQNSLEIIGIATRTDLLKTLAGTNAGQTRKHNIAQEMRNKVPNGQFTLLKLISTCAKDIETPIFLVGGFVRDLILNMPSPDLDFVVEGDALELASMLSEKYGGHVTSHKKFGTAKWWPFGANSDLSLSSIPMSQTEKDDLPDTIDLISARTEFYEKPTALPTIKKGSIKLDLHRRDFTINTMAVRLDGEFFGDVYDHWGGLNDLQKKTIRVLHSLSFVDDPTRMLRAVRFEQRFNFEIESRTLELMKEAVPLLDEVSGDRIRHELDQILLENNAIPMIGRLHQLGLLAQIHPSLKCDDALGKLLETFLFNQPDSNWIDFLKTDEFQRKTYGAYAILLRKAVANDIQSAIKRLRFKSDLQKILINIHELWQKQAALFRLPPGEFCTTIEKYAPLTIFIIWSVLENDDLKDKILEFVLQWRKIRPITTGEDLKELGIPPGPIYSAIIQKLRIAWINGDIKDETEEKILLEKIFSRIN